MKTEKTELLFALSLPYNEFDRHAATRVTGAELLKLANEIGLGTKLKDEGDKLLAGYEAMAGCTICVKAVKHAKCAIACYDCVLSTKGCDSSMVKIN